VLKPNRHGQEVQALSLVEAVTRTKADLAKSTPQELVTRLCAELMLRGRIEGVPAAAAARTYGGRPYPGDQSPIFLWWLVLTSIIARRE